MFLRPTLLAPGTQECIGVPIAKCQALLEDFRRGRPIKPTAFSIRCTLARCTEAQGSVDIVITWSDGSADTAGSSWQEIQ